MGTEKAYEAEPRIARQRKEHILRTRVIPSFSGHSPGEYIRGGERRRHRSIVRSCAYPSSHDIYELLLLQAADHTGKNAAFIHCIYVLLDRLFSRPRRGPVTEKLSVRSFEAFDCRLWVQAKRRLFPKGLFGKKLKLKLPRFYHVKLP